MAVTCVLIIIFSCLALVVICKTWQKADKELVPMIFQSKAFKFEAQELESIDIKWQKGNVKIIITEPGSGIIVRELSNRRLSKEDSMKLVISNGSLEVDWNHSFLPAAAIFGSTIKYLEIELPEDAVSNLGQLDCKLASGDVLISQINAANLKASVSRGSIYCDSLKANLALLRADHGQLELKNVEAEEIELQSNSADMFFDQSQVGSIKIKTTSGAVSFAGSMHEAVNIVTVSGDIHLKSSVYPKKAVLESVSGDISLSLPKDRGNFDLEYHSISGTFDSDFSMSNLGKHSGKTGLGTNKCFLSFKTTSGEMGLFELQKIG